MSSVEEHRAHAPEVLGFGVLTASDSRSPADDTSGDEIRRQVLAAGHQVIDSLIVQDEFAEIRTAVEVFLSRKGLDVVVVTGGTGLTPRDVTLEAVSPLFDREVPGFGELFRMLSWEQVGSAAMLSRATAGVVRDRVVFLLPGSPKAVALAMEKLIVPEAAHLVSLVRRHRP